MIQTNLYHHPSPCAFLTSESCRIKSERLGLISLITSIVATILASLTSPLGLIALPLIFKICIVTSQVAPLFAIPSFFWSLKRFYAFFKSGNFEELTK